MFLKHTMQIYFSNRSPHVVMTSIMADSHTLIIQYVWNYGRPVSLAIVDGFVGWLSVRLAVHQERFIHGLDH